MKKRDVIIIVAVVVLALLLLLIARFIPQTTKPSAGTFEPNKTDIVTTEPPKTESEKTESEKTEPTKTGVVKAEPSENPTTSATDNLQETDAMVQSTDFATVQPTLPPAKAYLKIQVGNAVYDPIPLVVDDQLTIKQPNGYENVAEVTAESVKMLSANCDNQDCVNQGTVTLANRGSRVLQNMIICLPNHVVLELLTPEEAQLAWESNYRD